MAPLFLLGLAAQNASWLTARQATVAQNISNANTPGFKAKDVKPFADVLEKAQLELKATNPLHIADDRAGGFVAGLKTAEPWETTSSGNSVSLEQELIKAGEVNRGYALNTGISKAFHHMMMSSVKGQA